MVDLNYFFYILSSLAAAVTAYQEYRDYTRCKKCPYLRAAYNKTQSEVPFINPEINPEFNKQ